MHWAALVESPPTGRILLAVAVLTAAGALLGALNGSRLPRAAVHALAAVTVGVGTAAALAATGLSVRLLWPLNWDELSLQLEQGLSGIQTVVWPYGGPEDDVRLAILLGAPALLALAAALAFWPVRSRITASVLRFMALVTLLCLYGIPVTDHDPGDPLLRGLVLFALVAAWLWAPRMRGREAVPALVTVAVVGLVALPLAARVDRAEALVDYSDWNWFGGKEVRFNWDHTYGPLDWPRDGTTLLEVRSPRPLYWKAEVLDTFDGLRWVRSRSNDAHQPPGRAARRPRHPLGPQHHRHGAFAAHRLRDRHRHALPRTGRGGGGQRRRGRHAAAPDRAAAPRRPVHGARLRAHAERRPRCAPRRIGTRSSCPSTPTWCCRGRARTR